MGFLALMAFSGWPDDFARAARSADEVIE